MYIDAPISFECFLTKRRQRPYLLFKYSFRIMWKCARDAFIWMFQLCFSAFAQREAGRAVFVSLRLSRLNFLNSASPDKVCIHRNLGWRGWVASKHCFVFVLSEVSWCVARENKILLYLLNIFHSPKSPLSEFGHRSDLNIISTPFSPSDVISLSESLSNNLARCLTNVVYLFLQFISVIPLWSARWEWKE